MDHSELIERFSFELHDIEDRLQQLKDGRVYEITNLRSDGHISTHAKKLEQMIVQLLLKIEGKSPTISDTLELFFSDKK